MTNAIRTDRWRPGESPLDAEDMPTMSEDDAATVLADLAGPYRVPCTWLALDSDTVLTFTGDPILAVLVADQLARLELGAGYPCVAGGGVAVDRVDIVLCGVPKTTFLDWRIARSDDDYVLQACVVRPARQLCEIGGAT